MTAHDIHFLCPGCLKPLSAPPVSDGATAHCPHCNSAMEVPNPKKIAEAGGKEVVAEEVAVNLHAKDQNVEAEMDMTPMVDVTFLLLIFFMVTASFSLQKSMQIPTPEKDEASTQHQEQPEEEADVITIRVDQYNTYQVITADDEIEAPSEQELLIQLRNARLSGINGVVPNSVIVLANGEARHDKVVFAIDAAGEVGIENVKITTVEDDEE